MFLPPLNEAADFGDTWNIYFPCAFDPNDLKNPWDYIPDSTMVRIWGIWQTAELAAFSATCSRFHEVVHSDVPLRNRVLIFFAESKLENGPKCLSLVWAFFEAKKIAQDPRSVPCNFYKIGCKNWGSLQRENIMHGKPVTVVNKFNFPSNASIPGSACVNNNNLILCSKNPSLFYQFDCESGKRLRAAPLQAQSSGGDVSVDFGVDEIPFQNVTEMPFCTDGNGHFLTVEGDGAVCVKVFSEAGQLLGEFPVGEENLHIQRPRPAGNVLVASAKFMYKKVTRGADNYYIQRLCATEKYIFALAKVDPHNPSPAILLVWDRKSEFWGQQARQFKIDSVVDMQLKGDSLYLLNKNKLAGHCDLIVLNLAEIKDWDGIESWESFVSAKTEQPRAVYHSVQYWKPQEEKVGVEIKSFAIDGSMLFIHCVDLKEHLRVFDLDNTTCSKQALKLDSCKYHKRDLTPDSSHIQQGATSLAIFPRKGNQVEFLDFYPTPEQFQSTLNREFPLLQEFPELLQRFCGLTTEQSWQHFGFWPMALKKNKKIVTKLQDILASNSAKIAHWGSSYYSNGPLSLEQCESIQVRYHQTLTENFNKSIGWVEQNISELELLRVQSKASKCSTSSIRKVQERREQLVERLDKLQERAKLKGSTWSYVWKSSDLSLTSPWDSVINEIKSFREYFFGEVINGRSQGELNRERVLDDENYRKLVSQVNELTRKFNSAGVIATLQGKICNPDIAK